MKVILEIEYHASEWTIIQLFKIIKDLGVRAEIFKMERKKDETSSQQTDSLEYFSISFIKKVVGMVTNMPDDFFEIRARSQEVAENRQIAMYLCRKYTRKSLREIGIEFGNKTPATIMHACKTIQNLTHTDKSFRTKLARIEERLITHVR
jgi:chromosomal replication initiator protein